MKKDFLKVTILAVLMAGLIVIFKMTVLDPTTLIMFFGICMTLTAGAKIKQAPNYLLSSASGIVWGLLFPLMLNFAATVPFQHDLMLFLAFFIFIMFVKGTHQILLKKTPANMVGYVFAGVAAVEFTGTAHWLSAALALFAGIVIAIIALNLSDKIFAVLQPKQL